MGNKNKSTLLPLITVFVIIIILLLGWLFVFKQERPMKVIKSVNALNTGRGYEVLEEESKFLTKEDSHANLMQFLEGHYGMDFYEQRENLFLFKKGDKLIVFETKRILGDNLIWELID